MEHVISSLISLGALWLIAMFGYRSYSVYRHRLVLFKLRDELFDLGADGVVAFDSKAYAFLRSLLNGHIRFGDRTDAAFTAVLWIALGREIRGGAAALEAEWKAALAPLSTEARKQLEVIRARMQLEVLRQVFVGELLWVPVFAVFILGLIVVAFAVTFARSPAMLFARTVETLEGKAKTVKLEWDVAATCAA
jgi:hypothetical protein